MLLVFALCFLCGFVANLPTAFSISCYSCGDYPGSSQPCSSPSVNHCDYFYDSCMSMSVTGEFYGIRYTTTIKNCSISQFQCNSSFVCDQVNNSVAASNGTLHSCSVNCCYGDLCNGQGGGGNVTLPPLTNAPTTSYPPFTTQNPSQGCGEVVNNTLKSPGYPGYYPNNMDCVYSVHIPNGMAMNIYFNDFDVEDSAYCGYDYLRISDENNHTIGTYCGQRSGQSVLVTGRYAVIHFYSDSSVPEGGYELFFSAVPIGNSSTSAPFTTYRPYTTYSPSTDYPTGVPVNVTAGPSGYPSVGPDPQSRLKYYINTLRALLTQVQ